MRFVTVSLAALLFAAPALATAPAPAPTAEAGTAPAAQTAAPEARTVTQTETPADTQAETPAEAAPATASETTSDASAQNTEAVAAPTAETSEPQHEAAPTGSTTQSSAEAEDAARRIISLQAYAMPTQIPPGSKSYEIMSSGEERRFILHVPRLLPRRFIPVVFVYHPFGITAADMELLTGFSQLADLKGFMVVYPEGRGDPQNWAYRSDAFSDQEEVFVQDMITFINRSFHTGPATIYATGMGVGAQMVARLACRMPNTFAAVGLVAGNYLQWSDCVNRPISVISIHGVNDQMMPFSGKALMMGGYGYAERMARLNNCKEGPSLIYNLPGAAATGWGNCRGKTEVLSFMLKPGGHGWPGSRITDRKSVV